MEPCIRLAIGCTGNTWLPVTTHSKPMLTLQHGDCLLNDLTHWHVSARCVFHLAHGGLKREALEFTEDKFLLRHYAAAMCSWLARPPVGFRPDCISKIGTSLSWSTCGRPLVCTVTLPINSWTCS